MIVGLIVGLIVGNYRASSWCGHMDGVRVWIVNARCLLSNPLLSRDNILGLYIGRIVAERAGRAHPPGKDLSSRLLVAVFYPNSFLLRRSFSKGLQHSATAMRASSNHSWGTKSNAF